MAVLAEQEAVFIGANKRTGCFDFNYCNLTIAYGASNNVALWKPLDPTHHGAYDTLKGHKADVTGLQFVPGSDTLVSIGEDSQVIVWEIKNRKYESIQTIFLEGGLVLNCLALWKDMIFVGANDGSVKVFCKKATSSEYTLLQSFTVAQGFFPTSLALQKVEEDAFILAVSGTKTNVYIFSFMHKEYSNETPSITLAATLAGHENWINCLSFVCEEHSKNYVLASGSEDRYIRLWRIKLNDQIDNSDEDETKLVLLSNKQYKFRISDDIKVAISFEALLMGHDDWVTSLKWHPALSNGKQGKDTTKLQLLSSSADTALMIWEMDETSGIWVCRNRLGELSIKGASTATGASGGFWSCLWFMEGSIQYIAAVGKTGSIRCYKANDEEAMDFESVLGVTGPNKEVTDLVWSGDGNYFMATSLDQTTRLFAPWNTNREGTCTWHEFARPQIHGYDMICLDNLGSSKFVSAGDEKLLRIFEMTHSVAKLLKCFCDVDISGGLAESASLPVLGLSNKAANEQLEAGEAAQSQQDAEEETEQSERTSNEDQDDVLAHLEIPPTEDYLQRYTLFPELEKLYGHGYEISCAAVSPGGALIATACKSNSAKHAAIRVFNAANEYRQCVQLLEGHNLTITSLEFSPDGKYLAAVSRDREISIWKVEDKVSGTFNLLKLTNKAHSKIIWDCSWCPSNTLGSFLISVSRDKTIKLWKVTDNDLDLVGQLKTNDAATTVASYKPNLINKKVIFAVGSEGGSITLYSGELKDGSIETITELANHITPSRRVTKVSFSNKEDDSLLLLGAASEDSSVRLYSIKLE